MKVIKRVLQFLWKETVFSDPNFYKDVPNSGFIFIMVENYQAWRIK
jgi:hypothetical protein